VTSNLDAQIAAEYCALAAGFRAVAAIRRADAERSNSPSLKQQFLDGAETWERSARHLDVKADVFAGFCPEKARMALAARRNLAGFSGRE
jgi:NAD(P)-dependent dehydrogenase (short-subunit alcohol dehydrogenase family)